MKLYFEMIKLEIKTSLQYKFSLITDFIGTFVGYMGNILIYYIMFNDFKTLNGWSFREMMFVYTFAGFTINLATLFFGHFLYIDQEIISGGFDNYLLKPISPFRFYLISKFNVVQGVSSVISFVIFIYVMCNNSIDWTPAKLLLLTICMVGAFLINAGTIILISSIAFWTKKSAELYDSVLWPAQYLSYLPLNIFPSILRAVFTFILPLAFVSFYPATLFLNLNYSYEKYRTYGYLTIVVGVVFYALCFIFWKFGTRKYESSGN